MIRSLREARVDVEGVLAVHGLLDHHRNQRLIEGSPDSVVHASSFALIILPTS
jgi:hypothetical protein